jgi:integrase
MAEVVDRWHLSRPAVGAAPCSEHSSRTRVLVPSVDHGRGKRWMVRYRDSEGRQRKESFDRRPDADARAKTVSVDLLRGSYVDPRQGKITLETYGRQWQAGLTCDPVTAAQIASRLSVHVYPKIGSVALGVLAKRPSLVQQWVKGLESDLSASTIKGVVMWVSTIFNAALDDGLVTRNPFRTGSVRAPRVDQKRAVPWDLRMVDAVAEALPKRYGVLPYIGAGCGHRQGELFGLAVDDVDFLGGRMVQVRRQVRIVNGVLVYSPPKGGKERAVPLPGSVGLRLSAHIADHPPMAVTLPWKTPDGEPHTAKLLFATPTREALDRNEFNRLWRAARRTAGVPDTRDNGCHVLRHTAASAWLANGVDIRTVAEYLGHTDPGFTLRVYSHLMPDAADRARKAMDAFFASAPDVPRAVPR